MDYRGIFRLSENDLDKIAYANNWLPKRVIDAHVHSWPNYADFRCVLNENAHVPGSMYNYF